MLSVAHINLIIFADGPYVSMSFSEMNVELRVNEHLPSRVLFVSILWIRVLTLGGAHSRTTQIGIWEANRHKFPNVVGLKAHYPSLHVTAFYGLRHEVDALLKSGTPADSHGFDLPTLDLRRVHPLMGQTP